MINQNMNHKSIDDGGPAFPEKPVGMDCTTTGLTKRDYFAAAALQGLMTHVDVREHWGETQVAEFCVLQADALIEVLSRTEL